MNSYLIFFASIIFSALLMILLRRLFYNKLRFPRRLRQVSLILLGLSLIFSLAMINKLNSALLIKAWPQTEGVVIKAEIAGARSYYPKVEYTYVVDSQSYSGLSSLNAPMFGGKRKRHNVAETLIRDHPPGKKLKIFYDPKNPSQSMVNNSIDWKVFGQTGFAIFMVMFSFWLVLIPVKKD